MFIIKDGLTIYPLLVVTMKCPICHTPTLNPVNLSTGLAAHQCSQCFGHWISSDNYWQWLERREQTEKEQPTKAVANLDKSATGNRLPPVVDNRTANFCADCKRLMTKTKVGRGLSFYIDRCSHCHGVWLDQNELENLIQKDLHHQIHYMFSSAWQFSVRQERLIEQKPA